jgi:serine/threonine protein kinase
VSSSVPEDLIKNEASIVDSIREHGGHENIIGVLKHGWLRGMALNVYFIDMELGTLTLADYIRYCKSFKSPTLDVAAIPASSPVFIHKDGTLLERIGNMWTIGLHLARGLEFMHRLGHVHRDMKPSNGMF